MVTITNAIINTRTGKVTYETSEYDLSSEPVIEPKDRVQELITLLKNKNIITENEADGI